MKRHWNVLVFPGGMENGIEIYNSLKYCKEVTLFSASAPIPNQAFYLYQHNNLCSDVRNDNWIPELNNIIKENKIDIIFPANSLVIDALALHKKEINCDILLPDDNILSITRSKKNTIDELLGVIPTPILYPNIDSVDEYPVFIKPDSGYGANGASIINSHDELLTVDFSSYVVQEFLPGKEYTIDCFSDNAGNLLFASGRERSRIRMATSMHAELLDNKLEAYFYWCAKQILSKIKINGAWFFQMKEDKGGQLKLLEIDVRIAGTMCFNRCRGVNFSLLSLYNFYNLPINIITNSEKISLDRCLKNRYIFNFDYENVYIDLDDTIIFDNKYNTDVIKFLFQCLNNKKKIILLSKHIGDGNDFLKQWRLDSIFSSVIWLKETDKKCDYINSSKSIYIDDSFSQRKEVAEKCNIPTFDMSMIECLIDDRI